MQFLRQNIEVAAYLFEKSHGSQLDPKELSVIENAGLTTPSPDIIANAIWSALEEPQDIDYRMAAYWALGKLARKEDKWKFINALEAEIKGQMHVAYQIMVALDNMGEPIFSRNELSFCDIALNNSDALAYIEKTMHHRH
jgi:hypothetical protein